MQPNRSNKSPSLVLMDYLVPFKSSHFLQTAEGDKQTIIKPGSQVLAFIIILIKESQNASAQYTNKLLSYRLALKQNSIMMEHTSIWCKHLIRGEKQNYDMTNFNTSPRFQLMPTSLNRVRHWSAFSCIGKANHGAKCSSQCPELALPHLPYHQAHACKLSLLLEL